MNRLASTKTALAAAIAVSALSITAATNAEARPFRGDIHITIGDSYGHGYGYRRERFGYGCRHLYRKAMRTGSRYWWHRFEECRYGY